MITQEKVNSKKMSKIKEIAPGVGYLKIIMVNVYFLYDVNDKDRWILVDGGMGKCAKRIRRAAEEFFGVNARPQAIILTHGHFDHIGALPDLAELWDVPVYAHKKEFPYLTGKSSYPPPDPGVGGGIMPLFSPLFKRSPINIEERLAELAEGDSLPVLAEWKVVASPGHSPGHISLFRENDRTLIAGDAFVTVKQESAFAIITQKKKVHGPPAYFTIDWYESERSVNKLVKLNPKLAATGHGRPMGGDELKYQLDYLVAHFADYAVPRQGRYVPQPAIAGEKGIIAVPQQTSNPYTKIVISAALIGAAGYALFKYLNTNKGYKNKMAHE